MEYLTDDNYINVLRNIKDIAIFIKFSASWCGPCRRIEAPFNNLAIINKTSHFYKVDVDDSRAIATHFQVKALPTIVAVRNGIEMDRVEGANVDEINQLVAKYK